jgi:hypothetical protein
MNINFHIERLVLDGLPVSDPDSSIVRAAIETELARVVAEQGLSGLSSGAVPCLSGSPIELAHDAKPEPVGHQIGRALFNTLASSASNNNSKL